MSQHPGITEKGDLCAAGRSLIERIDHFAPEHRPPSRRHRLVLDLGADDLQTIIDALDDICRSIDRQAVGGTTGAVDRGYHWELVTDPDVTAESFQVALADYLAARRRGEA